MRFFELLGSIGAQIFNRYSQKTMKNPVETQLKLLKQIIKLHQSTNFGIKHKFKTIRSVKQFQKHCQPHSYDYFKPYIDAFLSGRRDALFNSHLLFFAQTSGTTGAPKLIPITYNTIKYYNLGVLRTACNYISENPRENSGIISGKWLYLPAPPILRYLSDIPVGYITGLLMLPYGIQVWRYLLNFKCYAPLHLMHIRNAEEKFQRIVKECSTKNITMLVGVTPVIVNLLEYILKYTDVSTIDKLFPNLRLAIFSGVSPENYRSRLKEIIGRPISYREMYAASEGMLAVQLSNRPQLTPLYDAIFFEFIPLKDKSERLLINQLQKGEKYRVLITTHNGLYAYEIGDVVKCVSEDPPAFIVSFRSNVIDLADEKLTPSQVFASIEHSNKLNTCSIVDFCVIGVYQPRPHYIFLIEFDFHKKPSSYLNYLRSLDDSLEKLNDIYYQNRNGSNKGTLGPPELYVLKRHAFILLEDQIIQHGIPTGQIKTIHLSKDPNLLQLFESYTKEKISI